MLKQNKRVFSLLAACTFVILFAASLVAQGTSPIKVTAINLSPAAFKAGDLVTVKLTLQNTATKPYGCTGMKATIYAYKATPYTVTNRIWQANQAVALMAAGEKREVTFAAKFPVPAGNFPALYFQAWSPACAPDEFGQVATLIVKLECLYRFYPMISRVEMQKVNIN